MSEPNRSMYSGLLVCAVLLVLSVILTVDPLGGAVGASANLPSLASQEEYAEDTVLISDVEIPLAATGEYRGAEVFPLAVCVAAALLLFAALPSLAGALRKRSAERSE
ncbi:hypothetical protein LJC34_00970 [Oscillospiraceae bacterium OttesenSCG-928-G22]|nr:hypothetical protein [Oscillospiraceae bacterium OttesenSCG-928-G22]